MLAKKEPTGSSKRHRLQPAADLRWVGQGVAFRRGNQESLLYDVLDLVLSGQETAREPRDEARVVRIELSQSIFRLAGQRRSTAGHLRLELFGCERTGRQVESPSLYPRGLKPAHLRWKNPPGRPRCAYSRVKGGSGPRWRLEM